MGDIYNIINEPSQRTKKREYGRQQNNMMTNSMNSIPIDIPSLLRHYLRPSLNGATKMKIKPSLLITSWRQ
jgi:hypothetical protein